MYFLFRQEKRSICTVKERPTVGFIYAEKMLNLTNDCKFEQLFQRKLAENISCMHKKTLLIIMVELSKN